MARAKKVTKTVRKATKQTEAGSRDLLLASVGAVALGRKKAMKTLADAKQNVVDFSAYLNKSVKDSEKNAKKLRKQAEGKFNQFNKQAKAEVAKIQKQIKAKVTPIRKQIMAVVAEAKVQAETRFAPVLAKFGKKAAPKAKRTVGKEPTAKRVVKRTVKRVAKTVRRKAA
jgi:predicted  nucleic acid-binding Zn-ribbon protein